MGADGWRVAARTRGTLRRFLGFTGNLFILGLFKLQANSYFNIQEGRSKHDIFTKQFSLKNASLFNDSSFKRVAIFGSVSQSQDARTELSLFRETTFLGSNQQKLDKEHYPGEFVFIKSYAYIGIIYFDHSLARLPTCSADSTLLCPPCHSLRSRLGGSRCATRCAAR